MYALVRTTTWRFLIKGGHAARERIGLGHFTMDPDPAEKKHVESLFRVRDFTDVTLASEGEKKNEAHKNGPHIRQS